MQLVTKMAMLENYKYLLLLLLYYEIVH